MLHVEAVNLETDDWVFGCSATEIRGNQRFCSRAISLSHYVRKLPSKRFERKTLSLDLHKILEENPTWTHILLTALPTKEPVKISIIYYRYRISFYYYFYLYGLLASIEY